MASLTLNSGQNCLRRAHPVTEDSLQGLASPDKADKDLLEPLLYSAAAASLRWGSTSPTLQWLAGDFLEKLQLLFSLHSPYSSSSLSMFPSFLQFHCLFREAAPDSCILWGYLTPAVVSLKSLHICKFRSMSDNPVWRQSLPSMFYITSFLIPYIQLFFFYYLK